MRAGAARLCERTGALAGALPLLLICIGAAIAGMAGAAIGAAAGALTAATLLTLVIAATASPGRLRGTRSFAVTVAVAAVAMILAAFDAQIGRSEGVLLTAAAGFAGWSGFRLSDAGDAHWRMTSRGLTLAITGALALLIGTALALYQAPELAVGLPDGALMIGLTALGTAAAAPQAMFAVGRVRAGRGEEMLRETIVTGAICLFGGVGVAALIHPLSVPESFLRAPLLVLGFDLVVLIWIAFMRKALPRAAPLVGAVVYAAALVAYLKADG